MRKHLHLIFQLFCAVLILSGCQTSGTEPDHEVASPDYIQHEWEMTHDPKTGKVEDHRLWAYLLSQRSILGQTGRLDKARFYPASWRAVDDFFANLAVQKIVFDPNNPSTYYFCTGEGWNNADASQGAGVWKSTDAGTTWRQISSTLNDTFYYCHDMAVHPITSDVYVATRTGGLMRSSDGGGSWSQVLGQSNGALYNTTTDIEFTADNELFVAIGNFTTDGIYYSKTGDAGSWEKRMTGMPTAVRRIEIATAPSDAGVIYAVPTSSISSDSNRIHGVYRSVDKGLNWTECAKPGGDRNLAKVQGWYDLSLAVDPNNADVVLAGGLNVFRTTDGGDNWQQLFEGQRNLKTTLQYIHVDQHSVLFKNSDTVLISNDGGIYRCDAIQADTPVFYSLNDNYNVTQFYSCAMENVRGGQRVIGGTQDNGSLGSTASGISEFDQLSWADGSYCNINHTDPSVYFTTTQYQRIYRFRQDVIDTISNRKLNKNNTQFINPIEMDPNDPTVLYQLSEIGLWRLTNASFADRDDWKQASRSFGAFTAIGISRTPANVVFIGRNAGGRIYRIENALNTDENYFPINCDPRGYLPKEDAYCNCVVVDPNDVNHVLAIYANYGVQSIWESKNAMSDTALWLSQEGNLPDIPVRWAVMHPQNSKVVYLGTQAGVFMTTQLNDSNTIWKPVNDGLANLKVNMLRLRESDLTLVAATHGRGMFTGKIQSDYTVKWEERGPLNVGGRTRTMMFDPNDPSGKKLWAGSVSGGLWVVDNFDSARISFDATPETFEVRVGPNPVLDGQLSMLLDLEKDRTITYGLYAVTGQVIDEKTLSLSSGSHRVPVDMSRARQGMYFLKITSGDTKKVFRIYKAQ